MLESKFRIVRGGFRMQNVLAPKIRGHSRTVIRDRGWSRLITKTWDQALAIAERLARLASTLVQNVFYSIFHQEGAPAPVVLQTE